MDSLDPPFLWKEVHMPAALRSFALTPAWPAAQPHCPQPYLACNAQSRPCLQLRSWTSLQPWFAHLAGFLDVSVGSAHSWYWRTR